jgi:lysophospholipase L1-like esterase
MIGMNDCSDSNDITVDEFEENLHELADRVEGLDGQLVMQTTCPILPGSAPDREPQLPVFMDVVRSVAAEHDLPLVDHTRFWEQHADKHYYWMSNAFHPNEYGHRAFAYLLFQELDILDPESQTCRLYLP